MGRGREISTFGSCISERTISGDVEWLIGLKSILLGMRRMIKEEFKRKLSEEVIKRRCLRKVFKEGV